MHSDPPRLSLHNQWVLRTQVTIKHRIYIHVQLWSTIYLGLSSMLMWQTLYCNSSSFINRISSDERFCLATRELRVNDGMSTPTHCRERAVCGWATVPILAILEYEKAYSLTEKARLSLQEASHTHKNANHTVTANEKDVYDHWGAANQGWERFLYPTHSFTDLRNWGREQASRTDWGSHGFPVLF